MRHSLLYFMSQERVARLLGALVVVSSMHAEFVAAGNLSTLTSYQEPGAKKPTAEELLDNGLKLQDQKRYAEAEPLLVQALASLEKTNGANDPSTAVVVTLLGFLYRDMGRNPDALPLFVRALSISEMSGDEGSRSMIELNLHELARVYGEMGRYAEALPFAIRALAVSEQMYGVDHPKTMGKLTNLGIAYQRLDRHADALPLLTRAAVQTERARGSDDPVTGSALSNLAILYQEMARDTDALPLAVRALEISERANGASHPDTAISLRLLGVIHEGLGDHARALPLFRRALAITEAAYGPDHPFTGRAAGNLGDFYRASGRAADALPLLVRSLSISEKANGLVHPTTADCAARLALAYQRMGRYAEAVPLFVRGVSVAESMTGSESLQTASALAMLGASYRDVGRYSDALSLMIRGLSISERVNGAEHASTAVYLGNLAVLYRDMGRYHDALPLLTRALAISERTEGRDHPQTGLQVNNLAALYRDLDRKPEALALLLRALSISEKSRPDDAFAALCADNLAVLYLDLKQFTEALPTAIRGLAATERIYGPEHPSTAASLIRLATAHFRLSDPATAEPLFQRAWRISATAGTPEVAWNVQQSLRAFYARTAPELAIWYGKQAVNTLQAVRTANKSMDNATQRSFLARNVAAYSALADQLFAQGRLIEGQRVLAMLKESEYFDFIERDGASDPRKSRAEDTESERPWTERYQAISSQLVSLSKEYEEIQRINESVRTPQEKARLAKLDSDLTVGRQAFDAFSVDLMKELGQQGGQIASSARQREIGAKQLESLSALQGTLESLGHGSVILHYLIAENRLWILLTTPTIQVIRQASIGEADLNRLVGQYREAIANRDPKINEKGKTLHDLLIGPVAADLEQTKAETLMLSLDGSLRYLPMAALHDGEKYLAQRYRLAMYTEAAKANLKDPVKPQWRFAGFGLTEARANFSPLPSVRGELEGMVASGFPGDIKLNQDFTADSFKAGLARRPPVVHIASHFVFKPGTESDSFLLLGDGAPLSLQAIKRGNYRFTDVDLVTLSACETAVGGGLDANGREVEGFGALVQNQGAKGVIASLWPVADESTGQFMQLFYGYRQGSPGMTKAEAMQKAQEAFIEGRVALALTEVSRAAVKPPQTTSRVGTDHPYFWAPFTLLGNWR